MAGHVHMAESTWRGSRTWQFMHTWQSARTRMPYGREHMAEHAHMAEYVHMAQLTWHSAQGTQLHPAGCQRLGFWMVGGRRGRSWYAPSLA